MQKESSGTKEVKNYSMNSLHRKKKGLRCQVSITTKKDFPRAAKKTYICKTERAKPARYLMTTECVEKPQWEKTYTPRRMLTKREGGERKCRN
jgi:hypothetical protein